MKKLLFFIYAYVEKQVTITNLISRDSEEHGNAITDQTTLLMKRCVGRVALSQEGGKNHDVPILCRSAAHVDLNDGGHDRNRICRMPPTLEPGRTRSATSDQ